MNMDCKKKSFEKTCKFVGPCSPTPQKSPDFARNSPIRFFPVIRCETVKSGPRWIGWKIVHQAAIYVQHLYFRPNIKQKKKRYTFTKPEIEDQGVLFLHFGSFLSFENQKKLSALMRLLTKRNHPNWHAGYLKRRLFLVEHPCSMTHLDNGHWNKSLNFMFPTRYVIPKKFEGKTSSAK